MRRTRWLVVACAIGLGGCSQGVAGSGLDAGAAEDAAGRDASGPDAALADAGGLDASLPEDAGAPCQVDADCPAGWVCDFASTGGAKACLPGCHQGTDCAKGETCRLGPCTTCVGCPCVGRCEGCASDADCAAGLVCEPGVGCAGPSVCVPGCHRQDQCGAGEVCNQPACLTCPCPGLCEASSVCPGLPACGAPADCTYGATRCQAGCCSACPVIDPLPCPPGQCLHHGGMTPQGCQGPWVCATCGVSCPLIYAPVCAANYGTYGNECEAQAAGQEVLHDGPCLPGEGLDCNPPWSASCRAGQYCRDTCPACASPLPHLRCTLDGACATASDCPAGLTTPPCTKASRWECSKNLCAFFCGP